MARSTAPSAISAFEMLPVATREGLTQVNPLRLLTEESWAEVDAAFGANRDPFEGTTLEDDLSKLFSMIVKTISEAES
jgi:hypothetical protein